MTNENQPTATLGDLLKTYTGDCESYLKRLVIEPGMPPELAEAMCYCLLDGGKRLRPALVHMSAELISPNARDSELTRQAGAAIEMIHCYSLVHDDLPAMDDDSLRRGRPTVHVQYNEPMAILVGDALLTRALGMLAGADDARGGRLAAELASAAGPAGMIAGQVADMELCAVGEGMQGVSYIHLRKTAALLQCATRLGAICGGGDQSQVDSLGDYGKHLGLAFQIFDDLLDVTSSADALGKTPGKDAEAGKRTAIAEIGLEKAHSLGKELSQEALAALDAFGPEADNLRLLATLLTQRKH